MSDVNVSSSDSDIITQADLTKPGTSCGKDPTYGIADFVIFKYDKQYFRDVFVVKHRNEYKLRLMVINKCTTCLEIT